MDMDVKLRGRPYLRVSYDKSGRERSNSEQQDDNRRMWQGWEWGEAYSDAVSASRYATKARGDWPVLIADLREDRFGADALVLWESSRGSRQVGEWVELLDLCEKRAVRIAVTEHRRVYDPAVPRDRRMLLEDAVDSEYESAKTSRRLRRASAANAAEGRPHGRVPFGYMRVYDPATGNLVGQVPHEDEAPVVRELYERILAGHSLRQIARDFESKGVRRRSGTPFTPEHLRHLAVARLYVGERVHAPGKDATQRRNGEDATYTQGQWEPLVDRAVWLGVNRILKDPARRTSRPGKAKHWLSLQPHVVCDVCGSEIHASYRAGDRRLYFCRTRGCVRVDADELDQVAEDAVVAYLSRPDNWQKLTAGSDDTEALEAAQADVLSIRVELEDLADQVGRGELSVTFAARAEPGIQARLEKAKAREQELSTPSRLRGLIEPGPNVREQWVEAPTSAKRTMVRMVITPDLIGELRITKTPQPGKRVPAIDRVRWRTDD